MKVSNHIFETEYGCYLIPDEILNRAKELSVNGNLDDRRTRAYKYLKSWAYSPELVKQSKQRIELLRKDMERVILNV